jgi:hypothetical protein
MSRQPYLKAIEGTQAAIRAANKAVPVGMTTKSFRLFISLYNAHEKGQALTKDGVIKRAFALGNADSRGQGYQCVWWLIKKGFIEAEGAGWGAKLTPSLQGRNYVRAVERYLRNLRMNDL